MISKTPSPPYYAVIFTSKLSDTKTPSEYIKMDELLSNLVQDQDGFLGFESASSSIGITVSYWKNLDSILAWKNNETHQFAQSKGRHEWYKKFKVRICKVERDYGFGL